MKKAMEVGAFDAKNQLSKLLDQVERGQRFFITRRGKRVALLTSVHDPMASPPAERASEQLLTRFRQFRGSAKKGKESLRELVEKGHR